MNEEQRLESQKVAIENSSDKKSAKDYSKYFQTVYTPPSLKEAKKRGKEEVDYHKILISIQSLKGWVKIVNFTFVHMAAK